MNIQVPLQKDRDYLVQQLFKARVFMNVRRRQARKAPAILPVVAKRAA